MPHRGQRLFGGFDADAVVPQLAGRDEIVEDAEDVGPPVQRRRRTMQLQEVERLHLEVLEAAIHPGHEVLARVALAGLLRQAPPRLCRPPACVAWGVAPPPPPPPPPPPTPHAQKRSADTSLPARPSRRYSMTITLARSQITQEEGR